MAQRLCVACPCSSGTLAVAAVAATQHRLRSAPQLRAAAPSQVLDGVLKEIATALLQADVNVRLVANLR